MFELVHKPRLWGQSSNPLGLHLRTDHHFRWDGGALITFPLPKPENDQLFRQWQRDVHLEEPSIGFAAKKHEQWKFRKLLKFRENTVV